MNIEDLLKTLGDNAEAVNFVKELNANLSTNVQRVGELEEKNNDIIQSRQNLKDLVKGTFGLSEITEDSLKKFAGNVDEGLKADNEQLQAKLAETLTKLDGVESTHTQEINTMIMTDTLRGLGASELVWNDNALKDLTKVMLDGADREGGSFVFKNDGKTLFNERGKPMTVQDRLVSLQSDESVYLFKQKTGGGAPQDNNGHKPPPTDGVSKVQHIKDKYL